MLPPPPPFHLPGLFMQHKLSEKHSTEDQNSKNAATKLVTDHQQQLLLRRSDTMSCENMRNNDTLQCHKTVRRLVASLNLSSVTVTSSIRKDREKIIDVDEQEIEEQVIISLYRYVPPCLQRGPSCGVAALCMALNLIGQSCDFDVALRVAQEMNYTKQGEMFSAENLFSLARSLAPCEGRLLKKTDDIRKKGHQIIEELMQNNIVLIPYDRDGNSEPCLKSGQKAHWACLTGVVLIANQKATRHLIDNQDVSLIEDTEMPFLYHMNLIKNSRQCESVLQQETSYVYAMHGRSAHARLWRLDDVLMSNAQLTALDPYISDNLHAFVVPVEGVNGGLCSQIIVLNHCSDSRRLPATDYVQ